MITVFPGPALFTVAKHSQPPVHGLSTAISVGLVGPVGQALICMGDLASDVLADPVGRVGRRGDSCSKMRKGENEKGEENMSRARNTAGEGALMPGALEGLLKDAPFLQLRLPLAELEEQINCALLLYSTRIDLRPAALAATERQRGRFLKVVSDLQTLLDEQETGALMEHLTSFELANAINGSLAPDSEVLGNLGSLPIAELVVILAEVRAALENRVYPASAPQVAEFKKDAIPPLPELIGSLRSAFDAAFEPAEGSKSPPAAFDRFARFVLSEAKIRPAHGGEFAATAIADKHFVTSRPRGLNVLPSPRHKA